MPVQVKDDKVQEQEVTADVHHMLRTISTNGQYNIDGAKPVDAVDADVRTWLENGYRLAFAHYAGETTTGIRILYIFVKE